MAILETATQELTQKLSDPEILDRIDFNVEMVLAQNSSGPALKALKVLEPAVNQAKLSTELQLKYITLVNHLKFAALPKLKIEEISGLITSHLLLARNADYDLGTKIKDLFYFPDKDDFKKVDWLLRGFEGNNEILVNNIVFTDGKQYAGTVGNLIRLYKNTPQFQQGGGLAIASFLTNDANVKQMNAEVRQTLQQILSLYEWIRLKALQRNEDSIPPSFIATVVEVAVPTAPPLQPQIQPTQPSKELTNFEKKLAEASADHGADLESLKHKLEETAGAGKTAQIGSDIKKEIAAPNKPSPPPPLPKGEGSSKLNKILGPTELPAHVEKKVEVPKVVPPPPPPPPPVPKIVAQPKPVIPILPVKKPVASAPPPTPVWPNPKPIYSTAGLGGFSIKDIKSVEDLKRVEIAHLRQGALASQIDLIKTKIINLSKDLNTFPFYAVNAFEQSPLFQAYLAAGLSMFEGSKNSLLNQEEFEAVADLKRQIEQL